VALYNHQLPQAALGGKTPLQAMKEWFKSNPELFHRRPYDRPGCDMWPQGHEGDFFRGDEGELLFDSTKPYGTP